MNFSVFRCRVEQNAECGLCGRDLCLLPGLCLRFSEGVERWQSMCHYCGIDEAPAKTIELLRQRKGVAWDGLERYFTLEQLLTLTYCVR